MVIIIWDWIGLVNCEVNWGQLGPTPVKLITITSTLAVLFHHATIYIISLYCLFLKIGLLSVWIFLPLDNPLWWSVVPNYCANYPCYFSSLINVQLRSNSDLSLWSAMVNILEGVIFLLHILILLQVLDLALPPTFPLICEVVKMCHPIIKSIKMCVS